MKEAKQPVTVKIYDNIRESHCDIDCSTANADRHSRHPILFLLGLNKKTLHESWKWITDCLKICVQPDTLWYYFVL